MSDQSLRYRLRAATAPAHQRLDACVSAGLDFGAESYGRFLLGLARGIAPIEDALERAGIVRLVGDWPRRRRKQALEHDLAEMGLLWPTQMQTFSVVGMPEALGALYVLEGSRLGSQLLLKQARASVSPTVRSATRHLAHGASDGFWPSFVAILDTADDARQAPERVIDGANQAFAFVHDAFTAAPASGRMLQEARA